jgi:hypothetical protein
MLIPTHNNAGGVGALVTSAKNGKGTVKAIYKVNRVILINGERRKIDVEVLVNFAVTVQFL